MLYKGEAQIGNFVKKRKPAARQVPGALKLRSSYRLHRIESRATFPKKQSSAESAVLWAGRPAAGGKGSAPELAKKTQNSNAEKLALCGKNEKGYIESSFK